mmetsp:Transcript_20111/g.56543  ORF Transcript_20111/g.56543 Transcript_20111/m.56543 type:complete len:301 (+) Transcript_20111:130-1032(+)
MRAGAICGGARAARWGRPPGAPLPPPRRTSMLCSGCSAQCLAGCPAGCPAKPPRSNQPTTWSLTAQTMACPGGMRIRRGSSPLYSARRPSWRGTVTRQCRKPRYRAPSPWLWAMSRVLTTSNGLVATGPRHAAEKPLTMLCHGASVRPSPSCLPQSCRSTLAFAQNRHIWLVPLRSTVGPAPLHSPRRPSSLRMRPTAWAGPRYLAAAPPSCFCSRILTTSKGVTTSSASVTPAPKPAAMRRASESRPCSSRRAPWYRALVPMRMLYLHVRCVAKGTRPFHRARAPSSRTMVRPHPRTPR